jgi:hypothetical protein
MQQSLPDFCAAFQFCYDQEHRAHWHFAGEPTLAVEVHRAAVFECFACFTCFAVSRKPCSGFQQQHPVGVACGVRGGRPEFGLLAA